MPTIVAQQATFEVRLTIRDDKERGSQVVAHFPLGFLQGLHEGSNWLRDPAWQAGLLAEYIRPLIRGAITNVSYTYSSPYRVVVDEFTSYFMTPQSDSDIEEVAQLKFRTEQGGSSHISIPTVNSNLFTAEGLLIPSADLNALLGLLLGTEVHPNLYAPYTDYRGAKYTAYLLGRERFRRSK